MTKNTLSELWQYRELLYFFVWRDLKVRYKQTLVGVAWAVWHPLLTTVVLWLLFSRAGGIATDGVPYPIWDITSSGLNRAARRIRVNRYRIGEAVARHNRTWAHRRWRGEAVDTKRCPGVGESPCSVTIPADRERCHYCRRTLGLLERLRLVAA